MDKSHFDLSFLPNNQLVVDYVNLPEFAYQIGFKLF